MVLLSRQLAIRYPEARHMWFSFSQASQAPSLAQGQGWRCMNMPVACFLSKSQLVDKPGMSKISDFCLHNMVSQDSPSPNRSRQNGCIRAMEIFQSVTSSKCAHRLTEKSMYLRLSLARRSSVRNVNSMDLVGFCFNCLSEFSEVFSHYVR